MKLRYSIISVLAALMAVFTTSCEEENPVTLLDEVQVSSSYVALATAGNTVEVKVTASDAWTISEVPEWLTVSPTSGAAGESVVKFTAGAAAATRQAEVLLNCAGKTQRINVYQYAEEAEPEILTIAEAVALIKSGKQPESPVYFKGIVCRIQEISTQYGNATYFLSDDGSFGSDNWLEVYRGYWINGDKFTKGNEFAVGDELVVKGVLIDYNGTPETNQGTAEVISIKKSLIGIDGVELLGAEEGAGVTEFPLEGGSIKVTVASKGNGFHVAIPAEAKSWLHIADFGADYVTLEADRNDGGDRNTTVVFSTTSAGTTYSCEQAFTQKGAILEVSVADFLAAEVGDTQYRITGIISSVAKAEYGNVYIKDFSGEAYVYGIGAKGDFEKLGLKAGDIVTLVGKRGEYKGAAQMTGAVCESSISVTPISVADFRNLPDDVNAFYMLTGTVGQPTEDGTKWDIEKYGNFNLTDETGSVYIYGVYTGWGGKKGEFGSLGVKEGDELTIVAYKTSYKGLVEGVGYYFSHKAAE